MNELPSKWMKSVPGILYTIGTTLVGFGAYYQGWAADNPESAGIVGLSSAVLGIITGFGGYLVSLTNQDKAAGALPVAPKNADGDQVDQVDHLLAMATMQAMNNKDYPRARAIINVLDPVKAILLLSLLLVGCGGSAHGSFFPQKKKDVAMVGRLETVQSKVETPAPVADENDDIEKPTAEKFEAAADAIEGEVDDWILVEMKSGGKKVAFTTPKGSNLRLWPARAKLDSPHITYVRSMVPGEHELFASSVTKDNQPTNIISVMVVVHGAQPPPEPPPQPVPPVPPVPPQPVPPQPVPPVPPVPPSVVTASQVWVVTIDDVGARSDAISKVILNTDFWQSIKSQGHQFANLNKTNAAKAFKEQIDANGGIPCLVIYDAAITTWIDKNGVTKTGHRWLNQAPGEGRLPLDVSGIQALVNKYTGK